VRYAQAYIPDPYLYALILTFITAAAAFIWTPSTSEKIVTAWYDGVWAILAFAMQMALILSTGVTLAEAPQVKRLLERLASIPTNQAGAAVTVFLAGAVGSWPNWGFGSWPCADRARWPRVRETDFDFSSLPPKGNIVWASGLSS
jgi:short-chain fatty acids transporter